MIRYCDLIKDLPHGVGIDSTDYPLPLSLKIETRGSILQKYVTPDYVSLGLNFDPFVFEPIYTDGLQLKKDLQAPPSSYLGTDELGNVKFIPFDAGKGIFFDKDTDEPHYLSTLIESDTCVLVITPRVDTNELVFRVNVGGSLSYTPKGEICLVNDEEPLPLSFYGIDETGTKRWIQVTNLGLVRVLEQDQCLDYLYNKVTAGSGLKISLFDHQDYGKCILLDVNLLNGGSIVVDTAGQCLCLDGDQLFATPPGDYRYYGTNNVGQRGFWQWPSVYVEDKLVKASESDPSSGYLADKIVSAWGLDLIVETGLSGEQWIKISARNLSDMYVKVSGSDTTLGYLADKVVPGRCINVENQESNILLSVDPGCVGKDELVKVSKIDTHAAYLADKIEGRDGVYVDVIGSESSPQLELKVASRFPIESEVNISLHADIDVLPPGYYYGTSPVDGDVRWRPFPNVYIFRTSHRDKVPDYLSLKLKARDPVYITFDDDPVHGMTMKVNIRSACSIEVTDMGLSLVNDLQSVPEGYYYGTDEKGERGWRPFTSLYGVIVKCSKDSIPGPLSEKIVGKPPLRITEDRDATVKLVFDLDVSRSLSSTVGYSIGLFSSTPFSENVLYGYSLVNQSRSWIEFPDPYLIRLRQSSESRGYFRDLISFDPNFFKVEYYPIDQPYTDQNYYRFKIDVKVTGSLTIDDNNQITLEYNVLYPIQPGTFYGVDKNGRRGWLPIDEFISLETGKVLVTPSDTVPGYLSEKIIAGCNVSIVYRSDHIEIIGFYPSFPEFLKLLLKRYEDMCATDQLEIFIPDNIRKILDLNLDQFPCGRLLSSFDLGCGETTYVEDEQYYGCKIEHYEEGEGEVTGDRLSSFIILKSLDRNIKVNLNGDSGSHIDLGRKIVVSSGGILYDITSDTIVEHKEYNYPERVLHLKDTYFCCFDDIIYLVKGFKEIYRVWFKDFEPLSLVYYMYGYTILGKYQDDFCILYTDYELKPTKTYLFDYSDYIDIFNIGSQMSLLLSNNLAIQVTTSSIYAFKVETNMSILSHAYLYNKFYGVMADGDNICFNLGDRSILIKNSKEGESLTFYTDKYLLHYIAGNLYKVGYVADDVYLYTVDYDVLSLYGTQFTVSLLYKLNDGLQLVRISRPYMLSSDLNKYGLNLGFIDKKIVSDSNIKIVRDDSFRYTKISNPEYDQKVIKL